MTAFTFPQPGERRNASAISVPEPILAALYALATVGQRHLMVGGDYFATPQMREALWEVSILLSDPLLQAALEAASEAEDDLRAEHPF